MVVAAMKIQKNVLAKSVGNDFFFIKSMKTSTGDVNSFSSHF
jgi:hypothetical protein